MMKQIPFYFLPALLLPSFIAYATPVLFKDIGIETGPNQNGQEVEKYWTPERIASARPQGMPLPGQPQKSCVSGKDSPLNPADITKRPFWNMGKLFFSDDYGNNYYCTAQIAGQNNILLTAAHCFYDETAKKWFKNFLFQQQYSCEHSSKQMTLTAPSIDSRFATLTQNLVSFDYGFARLSGTSATNDYFQLLSQNYPPHELGEVTIAGYPRSNILLKGSSDALTDASNPYTYAFFNFKTWKGGASGSAWIASPLAIPS